MSSFNIHKYPFLMDGQFELENIQEELVNVYVNEKKGREKCFSHEDEGLLDARILDWDSNFFQSKIGRLFHLQANNKDQYLKLWQKLSYWIEDNQIKHISYRCNTRQEKSINFCIKNGFDIISGKYLTRINLKTHTHPFSNQKEFELRVAQKDDLATLSSIAYGNFLENRFIKDDFFKPSQAKDVYQLWVEKEVENDLNNILVAFNYGEVVGFSVIKKYKLSYFKYGFIDLIAVSSKHKKQGFGKLILKNSLKKIKNDGISVVFANIVNTNMPSLGMFQSVGFNIYSSLVELRKVM